MTVDIYLKNWLIHSLLLYSVQVKARFIGGSVGALVDCCGMRLSAVVIT